MLLPQPIGAQLLVFLPQLGACYTQLISACRLLLGNPWLQLASLGIQVMRVWHLHLEPQQRGKGTLSPSVLFRLFNLVHSTDIRHLFSLSCRLSQTQSNKKGITPWAFLWRKKKKSPEPVGTKLLLDPGGIAFRQSVFGKSLCFSSYSVMAAAEESWASCHCPVPFSFTLLAVVPCWKSKLSQEL